MSDRRPASRSPTSHPTASVAAAALTVALAGAAIAAPSLAGEPESKPAASKEKGKGANPAPTKPAPAKPVPNNADGKQIGTVREFPAGTADFTMREAFKCALDYPDDGAGFECYARLNVELNRDNENALTHLRMYQWRFFRQRASSYVVDAENFAVKVTRRDPAVVDDASKTAKLFLKSRLRDMPAPIILRREGGAWRVYANSL